MSQITPTTALVAANTSAATYHGRPGPRAMACVDGMTAAFSCLAVAGASRDEALPPPLLENLLGLLLRHVGALRELPDHIDPHHVLARPPRPPRTLERRNEEDVVCHRELVVLCRAVGGDGVQDIARLAGIERLVVGRGVPAQHRWIHARREQPHAELQGREALIRLEDHVLVGVLHGAVE